jgi:hypothetical protein
MTTDKQGDLVKKDTTHELHNSFQLFVETALERLVCFVCRWFGLCRWWIVRFVLLPCSCRLRVGRLSEGSIQGASKQQQQQQWQG